MIQVKQNQVPYSIVCIPGYTVGIGFLLKQQHSTYYKQYHQGMQSS